MREEWKGRERKGEVVKDKKRQGKKEERKGEHKVGRG